MINAFEGLQPDTPISLISDNREALLQAVQHNELGAAILLGAPSDRSLFVTPIALELIVVIVTPSNPIDSVSLDELRRILTGHLSDWASVGGTSAPIVVMTTPEESSTRLYIEGILLHAEMMSPSARIISDEQSLARTVAITPGSFGTIPYSSLIPEVSSVAIDGSIPSPSTARQESYPLLAQIVFVSAAEPEDLIRSFLDWIVSDEGQQVVRRYMLGFSD